MDAIKLIRIALNIITDRLLTILGLGLNFGLCCWTMWDPRLERVGVVALYSVFSYILLTKMERKDVGQGNQTNQE